MLKLERVWYAIALSAKVSEQMAYIDIYIVMVAMIYSLKVLELFYYCSFNILLCSSRL